MPSSEKYVHEECNPERKVVPLGEKCLLKTEVNIADKVIAIYFGLNIVHFQRKWIRQG